MSLGQGVESREHGPPKKPREPYTLTAVGSTRRHGLAAPQVMLSMALTMSTL